MKVSYVTFEHIDEVWPHVEALVKRTDDQETKSDDIYSAIKSGAWQLWIAEKDGHVVACCTTSFAHYPNQVKMCRIETCAGDGREDWMFVLKEIEDWARLNKCSAMDIFGRKGWERVLAPYDYEFEAILLRKRL